MTLWDLGEGVVCFSQMGMSDKFLGLVFPGSGFITPMCTYSHSSR